MMNSYLNVWASVMNVAKRFKDTHPDYNFGEVVNFDDIDGEAFPPGNLIGIYQLDYTENDTLIMAQCSFPISVEKDVDTLVLATAAGEFAQFVNKDIQPFYNYENEAIIGGMKPTGTVSISPPITTKSRKFLFTLQSFLFDRTAAFVPGP